MFLFCNIYIMHLPISPLSTLLNPCLETPQNISLPSQKHVLDLQNPKPKAPLLQNATMAHRQPTQHHQTSSSPGRHSLYLEPQRPHESSGRRFQASGTRRSRLQTPDRRSSRSGIYASEGEAAVFCGGSAGGGERGCERVV